MRIGGWEYPMALKRAVRPLVRRIRYTGLRPEDTLLASYPRSGSTWLRFLLAEALTGRDAEWESLNRSIADVGTHRQAPRLLGGVGRLVKTHDRAVGPCRRVIYLARDGRDVALSEYRWWVRGGLKQDFDAFLAEWLGGSNSLFGFWGDHVSYWLDSAVAAQGALLVVRFEDLRTDTEASLRRIVRFLGAEVSDETITAAIEHNSVERSRDKEERAPASEVRKHASAERFVGTGEVTRWRSNLSREQIEAIERRAGEALTRLGYPSAGTTYGAAGLAP